MSLTRILDKPIPSHSNILIGAIGAPKVGKDTFLCFLAECLYDDGHICEAWNNIDRVFETYKKDCVVLAPKIDSIEHLSHLQLHFPNTIIIRVGRPEHYPQFWTYNIRPDFSINNDSTMRVFKFYTKCLYTENIKLSTKWKSRYEIHNTTSTNTNK